MPIAGKPQSEFGHVNKVARCRTLDLVRDCE